MARQASAAGEVETAEAASAAGEGGCGEGRGREDEATRRSPWGILGGPRDFLRSCDVSTPPDTSVSPRLQDSKESPA
jgi:hypothetical protein